MPRHIIEKMYSNHDLAPEENQILAGVPYSTCRLLGNIPRLEAVTETILHEQERCTSDVASLQPRPWMILRACRDLVVHRDRHGSFSAALKFMEAASGIYHPACLAALRTGLDEISQLEAIQGTGIVRKSVKDLAAGMLILDPVTTSNGLVIVSANHELHTADIERIRNFDKSFGLKSSIRVRT